MNRLLQHSPVLLALVVGVGVAVSGPDLFHGWMQEDGVAEWATFFAFVAAGGMAIRLAVRAGDRITRLAAILLALFTIFVAGEEISWGHRVAAFTPPEIFLAHNYQQELNVHNLLKSVLDTRWMVAAIALGYGVALPLITRSKLAPSRSLIPWFMSIAALEIFYPFPLVGELAELLLGLTFVIDLDQRTNDRRERSALAVQLAAIVVAIVVTPALEAWIYGPQPVNVALAEGELMDLKAEIDAGTAIRKRLLKKRSVHKRIYTATKSRYLQFEDRTESTREGYFLDPWSQPYWVHYQRKTGRIVLYSFGPNRRRDWNKRDLDSAGDDIIVTIDRSLARKADR